MKSKILKWTGIVLAIFVVGFFAGAVFSYPGGPLEGIKNPWGAITHLGERIAPGGGDEEEEINLEDYPYLAKLTPEVEGRLECRYNFTITPAPDFYGPGALDIEVEGAVLVKEEFSCHTEDLILKDIYGNVIGDLGGGSSCGSPTHKAGEVFGFGYGIEGYNLPDNFSLTTEELFVELVITEVY